MAATRIITDFVNENSKLVSSYFVTNILILFLETVVISIILSKIYEKKELDYYSIRNLLFTYILIKIGSAIKNHIYDIITPLFYKHVKTVLFNSIINKYKINYKDLNIGYVLYNFQSMPMKYNELLIDVLHDYIPTFITIIICICFLFYLDPVVGAIALISLLSLIINVTLRSKDSIKLSKNEFYITIKDNEHINDKINNLFNIYISGTEEEEKESYNELKDILENATYENYSFYTVTGIITSIILVISLFLILVRIFLNDNKKLVIILIVLFQLISNMARATTLISYLFGVIGYSKNATKFLDEIMIENYSVSPSNTLNFDKSFDGPIKFKNVNYNYENNTNLFNNLSLDIKKHSKVAIFGKSGTGKSTLIKLLLGFYEISSGEISINGIDIKSIDVNLLRKNMSMATQMVKIFDGTVIENILYGSNQTKASVEIMYKDLLKIFKKLENGLETHLTVNGSNISGGQRQIISILRAFLKNTPIIILDEPTVGLDAKTKLALLKTIKNIKNKTIVIITHDKDVINYVDEMYELVDGKLVLFKK